MNVLITFSGMFEGLGTAIISPLKENEIDLDSYRKLLDYQINNGVKNIIVCGSTGEATTLTNEEQSSLIFSAINMCKGKNVKVIAGASSSSTSVSIKLAQRNKELGADGILVSVPPYNKPTQEGIFQHYKAIVDNVKIPTIIYNVPGRTSRDMTDDTIARLSELENIAALKDASGDLARVANVRIKAKPGFTLLSGEDATAVGFNAMGGNGIISVTSNIAPKLCAELQKYTAEGKYDKALEIQDKLTELHQIMFCEPNPIPVKYACSLLGFGDGGMRLPLTEPEEKNKEKIVNIMKKLRLII